MGDYFAREWAANSGQDCPADGSWRYIAANFFTASSHFSCEECWTVKSITVAENWIFPNSFKLFVNTMILSFV
jgi:hypothetical protein